jgi:HEAT repeat protein
MQEVAAIQEVPIGTIKYRLHEARKRLKKEMMRMVEENLKSEAPDDAFADRVLGLLSDPIEGRKWRSATAEKFEDAGERGKDGFARAMRSPNWKTRMHAIFYLTNFPRWNLEEGFAVDLLVGALQDNNRRVRIDAIVALGRLKGITNRSFSTQLLPLLEDPSRIVRLRVTKGLARYAEEISLEPVLRAMVKESDSRNLRKFRNLVGKILETQNVQN